MTGKTVDTDSIVAKNLPERIKPNIDFTKLARLAQSFKKPILANFFIEMEQNMANKILFMLDVNKIEKAL